MRGINNNNLRPGSQIPDVVYHAPRDKVKTSVGTRGGDCTSRILRSKERSNALSLIVDRKHQELT